MREATMISQLDFDPRDYHLRVLIEQMEREGRSEHAIDDAVRVAADGSSATEAESIKNSPPGDGVRSFNDWVQRLRPIGFPSNRRRAALLSERRHRS
jgi:hypothetical protein